MKRLQKEQQLAAILACALLLMFGWFRVTTVFFESRQQLAAVDPTQPSVAVLMYHHLLPAADITGLFADNNVVVSVEQFQHDIDTLQAQGYQTVSLRQLAAFVQDGTPLPPKSVLITFDDGYLSNKIYAAPILQQAGYTAVIFALTGWIEEHPQQFHANGLQYLSWPEIRELRKTFQFASHTDNLHQLAWNGQGQMTTLSAQEIATDIHRSMQKLQGTTYFSYPYGHYNDTARQVLSEQGITLAFTVEPVNVHQGDDPLTLGRWDMYQYSIEDVLIQKRK